MVVGENKPQRVCLDCLVRGGMMVVVIIQAPAESVVDALQRVYERKILPIEKEFMSEEFLKSTYLQAADFKAKPMVLLIGQYSVGKTSFIQFMIEKEFPDARIGPEPTTDCFHAVCYGGGM